MTEMLDFLRPRGEYLSLIAVALVLWRAVGPIARLTGTHEGTAGDVLWNGAIAYIVAGRLAYLALEAPRGLLDPLVLVRIGGGVEPLAGGAAVLLVLGWHARGGDRRARVALATAAALGLVAAAIAYDLACPLRDACYGAAAPPPLGFRMPGLADTRLATPLIEAALLLVALGLTLRRWPRLRVEARPLLLVGVVLALRAALTPASVRGIDAVGLDTLVVALLAVAALAVAAALQARGSPAAFRAPSDAPPAA